MNSQNTFKSYIVISLSSNTLHPSYRKPRIRLSLTKMEWTAQTQIGANAPWFTQTGNLLRDFSRFFYLILKVMLKAVGNAGHQHGSAHQQRKRHAENRAPVRISGPVVDWLAGVEALVPGLGIHQSVQDGAQGAGGHRKTQQGNQNPAELIVLPQLLHALNAVNAKRRGDGKKPARPVTQPVKIETMQAQRSAQKGEPGGDGLAFGACASSGGSGGGIHQQENLSEKPNDVMWRRGVSDVRVVQAIIPASCASLLRINAVGAGRFDFKA